MNENDDLAQMIGQLMLEKLMLIRRIKELEAQIPKPEPASE